MLKKRTLYVVVGNVTINGVPITGDHVRYVDDCMWDGKVANKGKKLRKADCTHAKFKFADKKRYRALGVPQNYELTIKLDHVSTMIEEVQ